MISSVSLMTGAKWGYLFSVDFTNKKERSRLNKVFINWLSNNNINCETWFSEYDLKSIEGDDLVEIKEGWTMRYSINYEFPNNKSRRKFHNYIRGLK